MGNSGSKGGSSEALLAKMESTQHEEVTKISCHSWKGQNVSNDKEFCEITSGNKDYLEPAKLNSGFGYLPDEIWCVILGHVTDTKGLASCYRACKQLNRLLEGQKVFFLFGEIFPHIRLYLKKKEILACRQTSRFWCDGVDRDLNDSNEFNPFNIHKRKERYECVRWAYDHKSGIFKNDMWYRRRTIRMPRCKGPIQNTSAGVWMQPMHTMSRLQKFLETFGGAPRDRSPFVGRSVVIHPFRRFSPLGGGSRSNPDQFYYDDYDQMNKRWIENIDEEAYWRHLFPLLSSHGHHIWHLNLMTHSQKYSLFTVQSVYENLCETLKRLANLRHLQFYADLPRRYWQCPPDLKGMLAELLAQRSLPKMKHLQSLCLPFEAHEYLFWTPLLVHLIEQSALALKRLEMWSIDNFEISRSALNVLSLTDLRLSRNSMDQVEQFLRSVSSCPLEAISLTDVTFGCHGGTGLTQLFHLISKLFGGTLLKLKLITSYYHCRCCDCESKRARVLERVTSEQALFLPNLRFLHLNKFKDVSIDLLLELTSLEKFICYFFVNHLHTSVSDLEKIDLRKILGSHQKEDRMDDGWKGEIYNSNVWTLVPSLQLLTIVMSDYSGSKTGIFDRKLARTRDM